ncbi:MULTISPECIES: HtaA domain-containing protein [Corynebacterium]|uniref:HtaA domain-containing protein n=1 Tax=Corynebacterium TaxID=1716 RepID=UPI0003B876EB|nr:MULTISPECIES: HtaA domain-containing protein [Corynebacterium]ERS40031.1 hypothetical protein HMPREF1292_00515 [Corynebacterium sp. KPL1995]ERS74228.1 hypothetical protein HMPREF1290_00516 [Corynebacterium sp. KPL1989]MDK8684390.1 HtaA domain-containing protein [Corynebacterium pseudodiphtheriticum]
MKNKFSLGASLCVGLAVIGGALTPAAYAQDAQGNAANTCQNPGVEIVDGKIHWGIKESFRKYINGPIAKGNWNIQGAVTQDSEDKQKQRAADFKFHFDVDPSKSAIELDKEGNVLSSNIQTQDSTLIFEGHKGALYTQMQSPYIKTEGQNVQAGTGYVGYHVPGKGMTEYTPEDRTEENKKTGTGEFAAGTTAGWTNGNNKLTLSGTNMRYKTQPGTNSDTGAIEGVDVIFMGIYNDNYNPEIDDVNVELNVKNTCLDKVEDNTAPEGNQPQEGANPPAQAPAQPPVKPEKPNDKQPSEKQPNDKQEEGAKPGDKQQDKKQPPADKKPGENTTPGKEEAKPEAPGSSLGADFSSNPADNKGLSKLQQFFNVALGLATFAGMATMIGNLFHKVFGPQFQHFMNNLPFKI